MEEFDYYEILEIEKTASSDEIKRSFRKLAMRYHPDKNQGDKEAEQRFKQINEAYQILSDEEKRGIYDRYGKSGLDGSFGSSGFEGFEGFADIFDSFFGGSTKQKRQKENLDLASDINLDFSQAVFGAKKEFTYYYYKSCESCGGSGGTKQTCSYCDGNGQIYQRQGFMTFSQTCPKCGGTGQILKEACKTCNGQGKTKIKDTITVDIPEGIDNGYRLRVSGKGNIGANGKRGDLYLNIYVKEDKTFIRKDDDVFVRIPVFFTLAALGGKIKVHTLRGEEEVSIKAGSKDKDLLVIKNQGVKNVRTGIKGDMILSIEILHPKSYTKEQKDLLEKLHHSFGGENSPQEGLFDSIVSSVKSWFND